MLRRFRGALYRKAGVRDFARTILGYLWPWIYRAGLTKEQVLSWLQGLLHCDVRKSRSRSADIIPTNLRDAIARLMAQQAWNCGDLLEALTEELEKPIPGFRWQADSKTGRHVLVKVKSEIGERAIVQGKRFADSIFLGAWWTTKNPRGSANIRLRNYIKRQNGAVFWNETLPDGGRQYGAFVVVDRRNADETANQLCRLADASDLDGSGEHRLSAISMEGIAEHREVRNSDQVTAGCIRSIKFNWEFSLPDLLNGRIQKFQRAKPYQDLISMLRAQ